MGTVLVIFSVFWTDNDLGVFWVNSDQIPLYCINIYIITVVLIAHYLAKSLIGLLQECTAGRCSSKSSTDSVASNADLLKRGSQGM